MEKDIFEKAHNRKSYCGFHRTYERIIQNYYIRNLLRRLKRYLKHCPNYQLNQTKRHAEWGKLHPILTPPRIFYTLTIDFILGLPRLKNGNNTMMSITDKFSKLLRTISGKDTWKAQDWAAVFLRHILTWGIPSAIISDRDPKFMSDLWRAIFKALGTELLVSIAYYPQTDGQSERTNQTVEIALRYFLTS